jgi:hypothetical protein
MLLLGDAWRPRGARPSKQVKRAANDVDLRAKAEPFLRASMRSASASCSTSGFPIRETSSIYSRVYSKIYSRIRMAPDATWFDGNPRLRTGGGGAAG